MAYKKGQLSIGFYTSLLIFLGAVAYITFQLFQLAPQTFDALREESVRIEAYQISELLINNEGHPADWETKPLGEIKRVGLSGNGATNSISSQKITGLKSICDSNYGDILRLLDMDDGLKIIIKDYSTGNTITCQPPQPYSERTNFNVVRVVSIDGLVSGEVYVEVWKR